ncbi:MAG: IS200/IS605 family transposase [Patescibacteria group bacterium]
MRIRSLNHSTYQTQYHLVWGTRWRRKYLKEYVKNELVTSLYATIKKHPTLHLETVNTNEDHVHLQIEIPPDTTIAAVVQRLKSEASAKLKKRFKFIRDMYIDGRIWSVGYFVSTIGLNEEQIRRYIVHQDRKERPRTLPSLFS